MARLDKGLIDLSLAISSIEIALHDYVYSPQRGLEKLQSALLSLQKISKLSTLHAFYHQRLNSFLAAVDGLLISGSPYFSHYHSAFLSAADALSQVVIAAQFSDDLSRQPDRLLAIDRSCWAVVISIADEKDISLVYRNYEARLEATQSNSVSVDAYLEALAGAGRVSFQLDSVKDSVLSGRFLLISVQSLSWLKRRFPSLQWQVLSVNEKEPLRVLCELSFLPLFQNVNMSRDSRYRLLALFEDRFKTLFYQDFGALFSSSLATVDKGGCLVPQAHSFTAFEPDERLAYFPVRHGGSVYIGCRDLSDAALKMTYMRCLGRDYLSYFLYEIDTSFGRFVFDQAECFGRYDVSEGDFLTVGGCLWFHPEEDIRAEVFLNMPLISRLDSAFCPMSLGVTQVLVVKQGGEYFALPYFSIREVEAVCSAMSAPRSWIKNIWLSQTGASLLEPWLLSKNTLPEVHGWPEKNKSTYPSKNGYYFGKAYGRMFCIEASLIFALLPYKATSSVTYFEDDKPCLASFFTHDGRSFDRRVSAELLHDGASSAYENADSSVEKMSFSVILEWMGESIVFSFASCDWFASLPGVNHTWELSSSSAESVRGFEDKVSRFTSLQDVGLVINKKNYLSFIAGFCHLHH